MADVQIQQTPTEGGSGSGLVWAIVVLILLGVIAWFVFGGGINRTSTTKVDINVPGSSTPAAPATPPSGGGTKTP